MDRFEYMLKNPELIMDENEKNQYRKQKHDDDEFLNIAEYICQEGNDLNGVKIHDF